MKNGELEKLMQGINSCGELRGVRFAYGLAKNKKILEKEFEIFREALKAPEDFKKYDNERIEICKELVDKDEKGDPKMDSSGYVITTRREEFDVRLKALQERNKEVVDAREKQIKEFNELMGKESDYKPYMISFDEVPKDITARQYDGIKDLIEEKK